MNCPLPAFSLPKRAITGGCAWLLLAADAAPAQSATNALPALAPPYGEIPPTFWQQHRLAVILAILALLIIAAFILKIWLRPKTPVPPAPGERARAALARLKNLPEDGTVLSSVSQILRHYAAESFGLPDGELTTADFVSALAQCDQMNAERRDQLAAFLRECDARKFSPATGKPPLNAAARALELVTRIHQHNGDTSKEGSKL